MIGGSGLTNLQAFERIRLAEGRVDYRHLWCKCWQVSRDGFPKVVRFPRECPNCSAITAMPFRAGTLAETRTQLDLRCDYCGHELTLEMKPPVLIVAPDRETDGAASSNNGPPAAGQGNQANDRRNSLEANRQRMRVGLRGLLRSSDGMHTITVLYSLDGHRARGRMRPLDPGNPFPAWLEPECGLQMHGYDGLPLDICITAVRRPRRDRKDDDHFAEFVVRPATR